MSSHSEISRMRIMLDASPGKIEEYRERYSYPFGQFRTPLTNYALADEPIPWCADNGMFTRRDIPKWRKWVDRFNENRERRPLFVTLPDIVGNARRTIELFHMFKRDLNELPRCLVLQNGINQCEIPWPELRAVFIGGDDAFKKSSEAFQAAETAKMLGLHVHVGRVNSVDRYNDWAEIADTCDGTGMIYDHMLEALLCAAAGSHPQQVLIV